MLVPKVNQLINQMLADKVIRVSNSCYINPLCIVLKADNSVRLTLDARRLNERTVADTFNNRNIDQLLHNIAGSHCYFKLNLKILHLSTYHPQSNVLERQNRTIPTYLRIFYRNRLKKKKKIV